MMTLPSRPRLSLAQPQRDGRRNSLPSSPPSMHDCHRRAHAAKPDARVRWLVDLDRRRTSSPTGRWNDRRVIIFTEYEDTGAG